MGLTLGLRQRACPSRQAQNPESSKPFEMITTSSITDSLARVGYKVLQFRNDCVTNRFAVTPQR
jgi:hypothetical protein